MKNLPGVARVLGRLILVGFDQFSVAPVLAFATNTFPGFSEVAGRASEPPGKWFNGSRIFIPFPKWKSVMFLHFFFPL